MKPVKKPATAVVAVPAPVKEISSIPPAATTIATNQMDSPAKTTPTSTATAAKGIFFLLIFISFLIIFLNHPVDVIRLVEQDQ